MLLLAAAMLGGCASQSRLEQDTSPQERAEMARIAESLCDDALFKQQQARFDRYIWRRSEMALAGVRENCPVGKATSRLVKVERIKSGDSDGPFLSNDHYVVMQSPGKWSTARFNSRGVYPDILITGWSLTASAREPLMIRQIEAEEKWAGQKRRATEFALVIAAILAALLGNRWLRARRARDAL